MNGPGEDKFVHAAKRLLDESVTELDWATLSRLAQARNRALERRAGRARNQVGQGVSISSIYNDMSVGSMETTNTNFRLLRW